MTVAQIVPGTQQFWLRFGTGTGSFPLPSPQLVGGDDALSDSSDSTYWDLGSRRDTDFQGPSQGFGQIAAPASPLAGSSLTWALRMATAVASGSTFTAGSAGLAIIVVSKEGPGPNNNDYGGRFYWEVDLSVPTPGSLDEFGDYSGDFSSPSFSSFYPDYPDGDSVTPTLDDLAGLVNSGEAWVEFSPYANFGFGSGLFETRIAEFGVGGTGTAVGIPPLRLTNRDDRERLTNRRSRQGSNRLTGYL